MSFFALHLAHHARSKKILESVLTTGGGPKVFFANFSLVLYDLRWVLFSIMPPSPLEKFSHAETSSPNFEIENEGLLGNLGSITRVKL